MKENKMHDIYSVIMNLAPWVIALCILCIQLGYVTRVENNRNVSIEKFVDSIRHLDQVIANGEKITINLRNRCYELEQELERVSGIGQSTIDKQHSEITQLQALNAAIADEMSFLRAVKDETAGYAAEKMQELFGILDRIYVDSETQLSPELINILHDILFRDDFAEVPVVDGEGFPMFYIGDTVRKTTGYPYPGVISGITITKAGKRRYTVESTEDSTLGMLHIFSGQNLELTKAGHMRRNKFAIVREHDRNIPFFNEDMMPVKDV